MTVHICVLGIDGSGKSTVTAALPALLSAETGATCAAAGEPFRVTAPDEDHLAHGFTPDGLPRSVRLSRFLKRLCRRFVDNRAIYPLCKLAHMLVQDSAAQHLARRYRADAVVSDGNAFLCAAGRAANYLVPASDGRADALPTVQDLSAVYTYIFEGRPIPPEHQARLPRLTKGRIIYRFSELLGLRAVWLPDIVIFLDISPNRALARLRARSGKLDAHENEVDLAQARDMYLKALAAFQHYRPTAAIHVINVDNQTVGETLQAIVAALRPHLTNTSAPHRGRDAVAPLGTTKLSSTDLVTKTFNYRYVVKYLIGQFGNDAWREPTFFFSPLGRLLLTEGYSARMMRAIYDQDKERGNLLDRVFLNYPLHRAVYDRLQILSQQVERELELRLKSGRNVTIFTAPSGFAYDLFRPLAAIAARSREAMARVRILAVDLDPHNILAAELKARAQGLGAELEFWRGDIADEALRRRCESYAPYDLALFVGLSSWLPKPLMVRHWQWLSRLMRADGLFFADCFTPAAYALSGRYVGYKASYYEPGLFRTIADYCGFNGAEAAAVAGRDAINHVLCFTPRAYAGEHERSAA